MTYCQVLLGKLEGEVVRVLLPLGDGTTGVLADVCIHTGERQVQNVCPVRPGQDWAHWSPI